VTWSAADRLEERVAPRRRGETRALKRGRERARRGATRPFARRLRRVESGGVRRRREDVVFGLLAESLDSFVFRRRGSVRLRALQRGGNHAPRVVRHLHVARRVPPRVEVGAVVGERGFAHHQHRVGTSAVRLEVQPERPGEALDRLRALAADVFAHHDLFARRVPQHRAHALERRVLIEVHAISTALLSHGCELRVAPLRVPPSLPTTASAAAAAAAEVATSAATSTPAPAPTAAPAAVHGVGGAAPNARTFHSSKHWRKRTTRQPVVVSQKGTRDAGSLLVGGGR
jgi:hypothetical protein